MKEVPLAGAIACLEMYGASQCMKGYRNALSFAEHQVNELIKSTDRPSVADLQELLRVLIKERTNHE